MCFPFKVIVADDDIIYPLEMVSILISAVLEADRRDAGASDGRTAFGAAGMRSSGFTGGLAPEKRKGRPCFILEGWGGAVYRKRWFMDCGGINVDGTRRDADCRSIADFTGLGNLSPRWHELVTAASAHPLARKRYESACVSDCLHAEASNKCRCPLPSDDMVVALWLERQDIMKQVLAFEGNLC